jgi:hypothetical protein
MNVFPAESDVVTALRSFLLSVLPAGTSVILGQVNRVPEPAGEDFVVMVPLRRPRLSTNVDGAEDVRFTGTIAGTILNVTDVDFGAIAVGSTIFGVGVAPATIVTAFGTGTGGIGTYVVSVSQNVAEEILAAGTTRVMAPTDVVVQLDVHGPASGDNVQMIEALFRDGYAVQFFEDLGTGISPLYAEEPHQAPFINAESQYESRWALNVHMQVDEIVSIPKQYADAIEVELRPVL